MASLPSFLSGFPHGCAIRGPPFCLINHSLVFLYWFFLIFPNSKLSAYQNYIFLSRLTPLVAPSYLVALNTTCVLTIPKFTSPAWTSTLNSRLVYTTSHLTFPPGCLIRISKSMRSKPNSYLSFHVK